SIIPVYKNCIKYSNEDSLIPPLISIICVGEFINNLSIIGICDIMILCTKKSLFPILIIVSCSILSNFLVYINIFGFSGLAKNRNSLPNMNIVLSLKSVEHSILVGISPNVFIKFHLLFLNVFISPFEFNTIKLLVN